MRRLVALLTASGVVIGAITAWGAATGEGRPVLTGREWGDHLADACADLPPRMAGVSDAASPEDLGDGLRAQVDGVEIVSERLHRARPDAGTVGVHHRAVVAVDRWRAAGADLADRLDRTPMITLGEVARGLATDAAAARDADRALASLMGRPCVVLGVDPVDERSAARAAGEALLDLSGLRRVAESDPGCVVAELEAVPFGVATALEHGEADSEVVEALSDVLHRCLDLPTLLEQIFADLGHDRAGARCLAGEVARRAGWPAFVGTIIDAPTDRFMSATAIGLEACA